MKNHLPHIKPALILTPAIFMLAFWIMTLSSSHVLDTEGVAKMIMWALIMSFGMAYSIAMFASEILNNDK